MQKLYLLLPNNNFKLILTQVLETLDYLPIQLEENQLAKAVGGKNKKYNYNSIIITDYNNLVNQTSYLKQFKHIIVVVAYQPELLPTNFNIASKQITYFNKIPTINNWKELLQNIII